MFGIKRKVHHGLAAALCLEHCRGEAAKLRASLLVQLGDRRGGGESGQDIHGRGCLPDGASIDTHCHAIALAVALDSISQHLDPLRDASHMLGRLHRLIAASDVGDENVGRAPAPSPAPDVHVSYAPGTFVGGVASPLLELTKKYLRFKGASDKLTVMLCLLGEISRTDGIRCVVYQTLPIAGGIEAMSKIGFVHPDADQIRDWSDDLEITDSAAPLSDLAGEVVAGMTLAIEQVDSFWPSYCRRYRLVSDQSTESTVTRS